MALDVGVHDGFEVLEFAVLEEVDDVDLETSRKHRWKAGNTGEYHEASDSLGNFNTNWKRSTQTSRMDAFLLVFQALKKRILSLN